MEIDKKSLTRREFLVGGGAVVASVILAACTPKTATSETTSAGTTPGSQSSVWAPRYGGTLKVIASPAPASIGWPPEVATNGTSQFAQCCLETMLHGDNKGNLIPWLAESYTLAEDMKSITFSLRKEVKFHDRSDFNAVVAKWNLDNLIEANLEPNWTSVDIMDDYTIRVNFKDWNVLLPATFSDADSPAFIVSKAAFDKNGIDYTRAHPVGTGPFVFKSYSLDSSFKAVKNPAYWAKDKQGGNLPFLNEIDYVFIADSTTQKMALQTGEGDMMRVMAGKQAADMEALGLTVKIAMTGNYCLIPDTANADSPWSKQEVREAVEFAIDKESIAKNLGYGFWEAPYQIPPRGSLSYNQDFAIERRYDLEKAKQLLAAAGLSDGFDTNVICMPDPSLKDLSLAIQDNLAKVGIKARLNYPEGGLFATYMFNGSWPKNGAMLMTTVGDLSYVSGLQFIFGIVGQSWLRKPEYIQAYKAALSSASLDVEKIRAVTDLITKDASIIPIAEGGEGRAQASSVVAGYNERGSITFWDSQLAWLNK